MLPLPPFQWHTPRSVSEALALLDQYGRDATILAGGTDLLPNMKRGLLEPTHVISLQEVRSLRSLRVESTHFELGAMLSLGAIAEHTLLREEALALAEAAASVGGPAHRTMGTLGGNLCLDTRCRYYNQSHFWRNALGFCLKKDGTKCHVVEGGRKCVAAATNDTAAAVLVLNGVLEIAGAKGSRSVLARDFYNADGVKNTTLEPGELVVAVRIPRRVGQRSAYEKLRYRAAIDFPLLSMAASAVFDGSVCTEFSLVVSALAARPRRVASVSNMIEGRTPEQISRVAVAACVGKECNPLPNIDGDVLWRKAMLPVLAERLLERVGL